MELKEKDRALAISRCKTLLDASEIEILDADIITMGNVQVTVRADGVKRIVEFDPEFDDAFVWPLEAGLLHQAALTGRPEVKRLQDLIAGVTEGVKRLDADMHTEFALKKLAEVHDALVNYGASLSV